VAGERTAAAEAAAAAATSANESAAEETERMRAMAEQQREVLQKQKALHMSAGWGRLPRNFTRAALDDERTLMEQRQQALEQAVGAEKLARVKAERAAAEAKVGLYKLKVPGFNP
jgi:hypothetical protein